MARELTVTVKEDAVRLLTRAARVVGDDAVLWVRFPDGSTRRARPVLGDWMGGTPQRPWPDVALIEEATAPVMADDPDREAELLEQREEARLGESTFKEQRDAALHLLRWLIGDLIPPLVPMRDEEG